MMFEHNHEHNTDNMNQNPVQGSNDTPLDQEPVYNSYSSMRSDEPGSYHNQNYYSQPRQTMPGEEQPPKKRHILPKVLAAAAGIAVISFASIQCYRFLDGNETLSMEEVSGLAHSFNYELPCRIARRVPRVYLR